MGIFNWFQRDVNTPADRHEAQTLHLLVRLVKKIDDRQEQQSREIADLRRQNEVIIDNTNRIITTLIKEP